MRYKYTTRPPRASHVTLSQPLLQLSWPSPQGSVSAVQESSGQGCER